MTTIEHVERRLRDRGGRLGRAAEVASSVRRRAQADRVTIVAAGLAFYTLLSLIPGLVASAALYTWVRDLASLARRIDSWTTAFPDEVQRLLVGQLLEVAGMTGTGAQLTFIVSVLGTFWAASKAARALMQSLNIVHDVEEDRRAAARRGIAVAVTITLVILAVLSLSLFEFTSKAAASTWVGTALDVVFWVCVPIAVAVAAAIAYRYGPNRPDASLQLVSPGVVVTTVVFVLATAALGLYVGVIGVGRAYGALGAFVGGGLWLLAVSWGLLIGAYVNTELGDDER